MRESPRYGRLIFGKKTTEAIVVGRQFDWRRNAFLTIDNGVFSLAVTMICDAISQHDLYPGSNFRPSENWCLKYVKRYVKNMQPMPISMAITFHDFGELFLAPTLSQRLRIEAKAAVWANALLGKTSN